MKSEAASGASPEERGPVSLRSMDDAKPPTLNWWISRFILSFVVGSLLATLLPLMEFREGLPSILVLHRGKSLAFYSGFLIVYFGFVLPATVLKKGNSGRPLAFCLLVAYVSLFSAIPLVFSAYISGVSARGLLSLASLTFLWAALPLVFQKWLPQRVALPLSRLLATSLLFLLPAVAVYLESFGKPLPESVLQWSSWHWLHRIAVLRAVPEFWTVHLSLILALSLVVVPRRFLSRVRPAAGISVLLLVTLPGESGRERRTTWRGPDAVQTVRLSSLSGGVARSGQRTPVRLSLPEGQGDVSLSAGGESERLRGKGAVREVLLTPGAQRDRVRIVMGGRTDEIPAPFEIVPNETLLAAWIAEDGGGDLPSLPPATPTERTVALRPEPFLRWPGALEAFDAVVVSSKLMRDPEWSRALERFVVFGGRLIIVDEEGSNSVEARGLGYLARRKGGEVSSAIRDLGRPTRLTSIDPEIFRALVPPHWQELDLSALLLFVLIYHGSFLLAFLLPLLLDARKATGVYLASVGFVVVFVAVGSWIVLGRIFLRDTQVYSPSLTLICMDESVSPSLAIRQFLGYASMSGEIRTLEVMADDVTSYRRNSDSAGPTVETAIGRRSFFKVPLDRSVNKALFRVDSQEAAPFRFRRIGDSESEFRLERLPLVEDPRGLGGILGEEFWSVEGGRFARRFVRDGERFVARGALEASPLPADVEALYRRLIGFFSKERDRYLVVPLRSLGRPDDVTTFFLTRDLSTLLLVPWPR